ncbi:MBL fold metallo-hydrolase [Symbiobacterium terraclitae]|uniref:MBL fold metallo-hydrolase n=1 Tax=Symbiobacterium terraclitae TaxID=557451 RepID=UPI0035B4FB1F
MQIITIASSSAGNCYLVDDGQAPLLLEAGIRCPDIRRGVGFGLSRLAGALVSHEHQDHARAVADVLKAGVDVYASSGTWEALGIKHHRAHAVRALQQARIGPWTVLPFDTVHDAAEPLGFLLATGPWKVLYLTDSGYCKYRFQGLTHIMLEVNHSVELLRQAVASGAIPLAHKNRVMRNHMSLERALEFLRACDLSRVTEIHLLHLSDANSDAQAFKTAVQRATGLPVFVAPAQG